MGAFLTRSQVLQAAGVGAAGENLLPASGPGPGVLGRVQALLSTGGPWCPGGKRREGVTFTQLASTSFGFGTQWNRRFNVPHSHCLM